MNRRKFGAGIVSLLSLAAVNPIEARGLSEERRIRIYNKFTGEFSVDMYFTEEMDDDIHNAVYLNVYDLAWLAHRIKGDKLIINRIGTSGGTPEVFEPKLIQFKHKLTDKYKYPYGHDIIVSGFSIRTANEVDYIHGDGVSSFDLMRALVKWIDIDEDNGWVLEETE